MALRFVLLGIIGGLLAVTATFALGGGLGMALLAYVGGGLVGTLGGIAFALMPQPETMAIGTESRA